MKVEQLLKTFRQRAADEAEPELYVDERALDFLAEAEEEAALRAKLLYDETTREICRLPVAVGKTRYQLDARIFEFAQVWLDRPATGTPTNSRQLRIVDQSNARRRERGGRNCDYGNNWRRPNGALRTGNYLHECSVDGNTLALYTIPDASFAFDAEPAVLRLCVYRLPLKPIENIKDCLEIPAVHHRGLIDWMLHRAFCTKDGEENDDARETRWLTSFTQRFGERPSADAMRMQTENRNRTTRYGGY